MKNIKSFWIVLLVLSLFFLGCVGKTPSGTSAPTPTITETPLPTITPTVQSPVITSTPMIYVPATYIVWIDSNYGFYKVREVRENLSVQLPLDLNPANFSINVGDTIRWMNDDSYDFPLTLVSNEGLWIDRAGLMRYQGERITYEFNMTGTYTFSIKEYPRLVSQKITVVNP